MTPIAQIQNQTHNIWHPFTQMQNCKIPICIVKGKGAYLYDVNGKKYIDAISSWWVNLHGHSHPYIAQKVSEQLLKLEHVIFADFTHPSALDLAERLLKILPSNQSKIFYSDDGSTAVEVAIKMTLQYWHNKGINKDKIIAFKNAYHGDTFGAMSVSGRSGFSKPFNNKLFDVIFIDTPLAGCEATSKDQLLQVLKQNDIAAFIFEPLIQGAGGMRIYSSEILDELLQICHQKNIITIADEVMTGFGRTGKYFASDYIINKPDILCMAKGLTGGTMAMGATSCKQEIYNAFLSDNLFKTFFHGHSYTANPLACTAAAASLDLLESKECLSSIKRIEKNHKAFYNQIKKNKNVKDCRTLGTIIALELKTENETSYFNKEKEKYYTFFLQQGILIRPLGNVIYILPPYCINDDDLTYCYNTILEALNKF